MMDDDRPDDLGIEVKSDAESENEGDLVHMVIEKPKEKWDCESIISMLKHIRSLIIGIISREIIIYTLPAMSILLPSSIFTSLNNFFSGTYSNLYNHPKLIEEPGKVYLNFTLIQKNYFEYENAVLCFYWKFLQRFN